MPFRIHYRGVCLIRLEFKACNHVMNYGQWKAVYNSSQLYNILPSWGHVQTIQLFNDRAASKPYCLMSSKGNKLQIAPCDTQQLSQLYMIKIRSDPAYYAAMLNYTDKYIVHQKPVVAHQILRPSMVISIAQITNRDDEKLLSEWYMLPEGESMNIPTDSSLKCASVVDDASNPDPSVAPVLQMVPCDGNSLNQKLIIERSTSNAWIKYIRKRLEIAHYFPKATVKM